MAADNSENCFCSYHQWRGAHAVFVCVSVCIFFVCFVCLQYMNVCVDVNTCVFVCACVTIHRGRGALPEAGADDHRHLCGVVGGWHRLCGGLLQNQVCVFEEKINYFPIYKRQQTFKLT